MKNLECVTCVQVTKSAYFNYHYIIGVANYLNAKCRKLPLIVIRIFIYYILEVANLLHAIKLS